MKTNTEKLLEKITLSQFIDALTIVKEFPELCPQFFAKKESVLSNGNVHLIDNGTTSNPSQKKKQIENKISKLKSVYKEGMTIKQLSEKSGIEINFVNNHWSKIEPRPAKEVTYSILKKHYTKGMSVYKLARITGFHPTTIYQNYLDRLKKEFATSNQYTKQVS